MRDLIQPTGFGPFHCGGVEILRRIFVTVRDRNWREISPTQWTCRVEEATASIGVEARHISDLVDFEWQGTLRCSADGRSVHFEFEGEVRRTMDVCRLGLVVLHPIEAMLGARIFAQADENQQTLIVSSTIAPQPIIDGIPVAMTQPFSSLSIECADLGLLELQFGGDLFEMEDQRNWGDASFKTYCTPLGLGFPRRVNKGTRIAHHLDLRFTPIGAQAGASVRQAARRATSGVFPTLGRESRGSDASDSRDPDWHHLKLEVCDLDDLRELKICLEQHQTSRLEIGVDVRIENHLPGLAAWLSGHRARLARLLVYGSGVSLPSAASITDWRRALDAAGLADMPVFAATRGYFVEYNRSSGMRPGLCAGISFPLTATVHADDPVTIAENVATIRDIADTARHVAHSTELSVAPLALHFPSSPASARFPQSMIAPWLAATLLYAGTTGIAAITLANDVVSRAPAGLLQCLLRCSGFTVKLLTDEQPNSVHAALLRHPVHGTVQILGINLNDVPCQLNLESFGARVRSLVEVRNGQAVSIDAARIEIAAFGVRWLECNLS